MMKSCLTRNVRDLGVREDSIHITAYKFRPVHIKISTHVSGVHLNSLSQSANWPAEFSQSQQGKTFTLSGLTRSGFRSYTKKVRRSKIFGQGYWFFLHFEKFVSSGQQSRHFVHSVLHKGEILIRKGEIFGVLPRSSIKYLAGNLSVRIILREILQIFSPEVRANQHNVGDSIERSLDEQLLFLNFTWSSAISNGVRPSMVFRFFKHFRFPTISWIALYWPDWAAKWRQVQSCLFDFYKANIGRVMELIKNIFSCYYYRNPPTPTQFFMTNLRGPSHLEYDTMCYYRVIHKP